MVSVSGFDDGQPAPVRVPDELDVAPPGALLAEWLDDIPVELVSGYDSVVVLAAAYRQLCRQQAVFYRALAETGLRAPGSASTVARLADPGEFAAEEARAKLVWSRQRSQREYQLGFELFVRYPQVGDALIDGHIDLPRARALIDWTDGLTEEQAAAIIDRLLPRAAGLVVGALIDEIKRAAIAVDPEWAERRYRAAVKTRRVRGYRNPDGTAGLAGYAQPVDRVVAACGRIDDLARACKRAGDPRKVDLIRSDLFLRMLDGSFATMTDAEIVDHVLANPLDDLTDSPDPHDSDNGTGSDGDTGGDGIGDGGEGAAGPDAGSGGSGPGGGSGGGRGGRGPGAASEPTGDERAVPDAHADVRRGSGDARPGRNTDTDTDTAAAAAAAERAACVPELRVALVSLLELSEAPGLLPGWDFVPASLARRLVTAMTAGEWRWVVAGADGRALDGGLVTTRPFDLAVSRRLGRRGGIVEVAVSEGDLERLAIDPGRHGRWAGVIADVWRQYQQGRAGPAGRARPPGGRSRSRSGADQAESGGQAGRRFPGARLRRWIEIRDRDCRHPCCRAPAASAELDHRVGWAAGGATSAQNLGAVCRRDHRIKDEGGWRVDEPVAGVSVWTSPLGHTVIAGPPLVAFPTVSPISRDDRLLPADGWPDPCGCLLRPCPHDQRASRAAGSNDLLGQSRRSYRLYDTDGKPFTERLCREYHAWQALYEDRPPF